MSYALILDSDLARVQASLDCIRPFGLEVHIAERGEEALGVVARHGHPKLLIVDLQCEAAAAVEVIDAACAGNVPGASVIAWCPTRAVREFVGCRFHGHPVRTFAQGSAARVMAPAIERALRVDVPASVQEVDETIAHLLADAQRLCVAEGAAALLKAPGEWRFRSWVSWQPESKAPSVLESLPHVFNVMIEHGEPLIWSDHGAWALSGDVAPMGPSDIQALAAVPIVSQDGTVGVLCVFDIKPLTLSKSRLEAFKALGHVTLPAPVAERPAPALAPGESERAETKSGAAGPVLLDRQSGDFAIARELARTRRAKQCLTVVMFAVDFVEANTAGGGAADPIAAIHDTLATAVRGSDLAIRWSDGEFLLVLSGLTAAEARPIAERIRAVAHAAQRHAVAVSGGIAELSPAESAASIIKRASERVQLARTRGHNRVA